MFSINFAYDFIRTANICQLSHNHYPRNPLFYYYQQIVLLKHNMKKIKTKTIFKSEFSDWRRTADI